MVGYNHCEFLENFNALETNSVMAYLDPASNPGAKPQRLSVKSSKNSTWKKIEFIVNV